MSDRARLVLASGSAARKAMLAGAGLSFDVHSADIDEDHVRRTMQAESAHVSGGEIAAALAREKALSVSRLEAGAVVIGSDQVLGLGEKLFAKAATLAAARETLLELRGQSHDLISAVAVARDGVILWECWESAQMTMRAFSDAFLDDYLDAAGERILGSVGCYELEGRGVQLFERINGDFFTILGMPLLPLLAALRNARVLTS